MMDVSREAVRVSRGAVLWVVAGKTDKRNYQPGPEGLIWEWYRSGGMQECPCYWHRVGIAGSGGDQWFRKDVEYIVCLKREPKFPWSDNTANGKPPRWAPGGAMSHRLSDGTRVNQWGKTGTRTGTSVRADGVVRSDSTRPSHRATTKGDVVHLKRMKGRGHEGNGNEEVQGYKPPAIANPGTLIKGITVGGGQMGHPLAHENEAPFPQKLAEWFIRSHCPPGGVVLDPFAGSGSSIRAAEALGRHGIGFDLRMSQCRIGKQSCERPHQPVVKKSRRKTGTMPLFAGDD
jgi:hypothetical protein